MDTGSSCNVMSISTLKYALNEQQPKLNPSKTILKVYNGTKIKPLGTINL